MSKKDLAGLLMLLLLQFTLKQDHTSTGSRILAAKYFAEMKENTNVQLKLRIRRIPTSYWFYT